MTKQEALDAVWKWFVVGGGQKSENLMGTCLYRGLNGARCAAGVLIPDKMYSSRMEGSTIGILIHSHNFPELEILISPLKDLVIEMQALHDGASKDTERTWRSYSGTDYLFRIGGAPTFAEYMRRGLTIIADRHNLAIPNAESTAESA
jgi:hypothetical protein